MEYNNNSNLINTIEEYVHLNSEAELAVIGGLLLQPNKIFEVREVLVGEDFYHSKNKIIYNAMTTLNDKGKEIDIVEIAELLQTQNLLEDAGGFSTLTDTATAVPSAANIGHYTQIVKEKSILRTLVKKSKDIIQLSYSDNDLASILNSAEREIGQISATTNEKKLKHVKDFLPEIYLETSKIADSDTNLSGIITGYRDLDKLTSGFQREDLIIVAARPSVGKTAFALNIATNVSKLNEGSNVAIFSLEMGAEQLIKRVLSSEGHIDAQNLRTGSLTNEEWNSLLNTINYLSNYGIYIDDSPGITVNDIRSRCRELKRTVGLDMILIDYLQLIRGTKKNENRQQEVSEISRSLKQIARELEVPVIALSQLSRSVETRQDKRPMLSDLRESGSIEQDADVVAFLYREDYYDKETEDANTIEIIVAKQRNGPTDTVKLAFKKEFNKFISVDWSQQWQ